AELGCKLQRGVGVIEIIVAQLLALHLAGLGNAGSRGAKREIKGRLLVRVLAVAQLLRLAPDDEAGLRKGLALVGRSEPARDRRVIGGTPGKGLRGKPAP